MKTLSEQQIEKVLRDAPQPVAPWGMKEKLLEQVPGEARQFPPAAQRSSWIRRWWPVLVPAGFSLVCAVVAAMQQQQIRELKQAVQTYSSNADARQKDPAQKSAAEISAEDTLAEQTAEIDRLKQQIAQLAPEIARLEQLRSQNQKLLAQLNAPKTGGFSPSEVADLEAARARAMKIQCVNNLKQMGLAVRIWAGDNNNAYPPDIVCMSNELSTPKILVCPADSAHQVAANFSSYTDANCSYEYFTGGTDADPTRVLFRCPVHGTVCLCDGSVQAEVGKTHPEWLVQRNGKLYFEPPSN